MKQGIAPVGFSLLLILGLVFGWAVPPAQAMTSTNQLVSEVWRIVNYAYVDPTFNHQDWWSVRRQFLKQPPRDRESVYARVEAMLDLLGDPYTRFLPPNQYKNLQLNTAGELSGVGLQIATEPETAELVVITPLQGSPADLAGLQPGDHILTIDGLDTTTLTLDESAQALRGPAGTLVTLTVVSPNQPVWTVDLIRDHIALTSVVAELHTEDLTDQSLKVAYIRLGQFSSKSPAEVTQAIANFEAAGAQAYVLDLRNNPGGVMEAGIEIARLWLDGGTVVYVVNRQGMLNRYEATAPGLTKAPLVVLVNQGSASASEILAGALGDNGRAQIIGEPTFGKGLIQSVFNLSDGSGLAVTVARYETPDHRDIHQVGIQPDRTVAATVPPDQMGTLNDPVYQAALEHLKTQAALTDAT